jgi:GntR family transcriptional repressor for pyruvate dehydrogenase complex
MRPITRSNVTEEVYERLLSQIISGTWTAGRRIPSEHKLVEMLGVSRITVRNALHRLIGIGLLESRHGDGTFVTKLKSDIGIGLLTPSFLLDDHNVNEILEFRAIIEIGAAGLAALNATEEEAEELKRLAGELFAHAEDYTAYAHWDFLFHQALGKAGHNRMIIKVSELVRDMLESAFVNILRHTGGPLQIPRHEKIADCVANRDSEGARREMQLLMDMFLENVRTRMDTD